MVESKFRDTCFQTNVEFSQDVELLQDVEHL